MKTPVERVRELCESHGIAVSRLEKDLGFGNGYLNPKKIKKVDYDRAVLIADCAEAVIKAHRPFAHSNIRTGTVMGKNRAGFIGSRKKQIHVPRLLSQNLLMKQRVNEVRTAFDRRCIRKKREQRARHRSLTRGRTRRGNQYAGNVTNHHSGSIAECTEKKKSFCSAFHHLATCHKYVKMLYY